MSWLLPHISICDALLQSGGRHACAPAVGTTMPLASRSMQLFSTSALLGPSCSSQVVSLQSKHGIIQGWSDTLFAFHASWGLRLSCMKGWLGFGGPGCFSAVQMMLTRPEASAQAPSMCQAT